MAEAHESSSAPNSYAETPRPARPSSRKSDQPRAETADRHVEQPAIKHLTITIDADTAAVIRVDGLDATGTRRELSADQRAKLVKNWTDHSPTTQTGIHMDTTVEAEDLARLALGKRAKGNTRIRRALIANLLNEQEEGATDGDGAGTNADEGDDEERQLIQALVGTRLLRRRKLRKLLKAKLVAERGETDEYDEDVEDTEETGENDRELARLLIGSRLLKRRRVRRALLAAAVRERAAASEGDDETDEDVAEEGGDREGNFIRLVIGSRILRRRRVRRALLAHLAKERGEADTESDVDEDAVDEGADLEREVARLLIGGRTVRRRRMGRAAVARGRFDSDDF